MFYELVQIFDVCYCLFIIDVVLAYSCTFVLCANTFVFVVTCNLTVQCAWTLFVTKLHVLTRIFKYSDSNYMKSHLHSFTSSLNIRFLSGCFFASSDITLYTIPKKKFLAEYEENLSLSGFQASVAVSSTEASLGQSSTQPLVGSSSSSSSQNDDNNVPFQYRIGLLSSSTRRVLSTKDMKPFEVPLETKDNAVELHEFLKTTWMEYPLEQRWIGFPKPYIQKIKDNPSEHVYNVVDGVHRWISCYVYNFVMKASELPSDFKIHSKILKQDLTNRVLTLISSSINDAEQTTLKMNAVSLARYVSSMSKEGYTLAVLEQNLTQLNGKSAASISQFKQVGDRFDKFDLLDRLQKILQIIYPMKPTTCTHSRRTSFSPELCQMLSRRQMPLLAWILLNEWPFNESVRWMSRNKRLATVLPMPKEKGLRNLRKASPFGPSFQP